MMNEYIASEFTLTAYKALLTLAQTRFCFKNYSNFLDHDNFLLLRHDVDFSLEHALKTARIEHEMQIGSTYFIHLHNEFYNALDVGSLKLMRELLSLGHHIGLHFDVHYYNIKGKEELEYWLAFEKSLIERVLDCRIDVFSFHNTNDFTMGCEEHDYAGMLNTYSTYFKTQASYCSDSNGYWRYRKLEEVLLDPEIKKLQVLLHPEWWTDEELMPREKVYRCAQYRFESTVANYDQALIDFGRLNLS
ncbi:hypothetical protein DIZ81_09710 [Legionella taurinensis]|uniref:Uncharacterized protein n=1 Tax=Legionella taurinensis TaxID=70611 RepID=A0A3A5L9J7_9GAMM|nr:hypothetical protein [Legionella taurinensis]MDX1838002.1 hypothetical protein [Legionella taurinensis]PUT39410.1 hypothetical protein DB744_09720 [Legionella taurinensis]PUT41719.1 hypothetical protein DB746_08635 [Legionella taurinensis]PUT44553.1 hypothetical protein DB743_07850 [Legionella taurinensis]PUT46797.1 hypothetical protein DB745_09715 [Legionella taurinensis]